MQQDLIIAATIFPSAFLPGVPLLLLPGETVRSPSEEECSKEAVESFIYGSVLPGLCLLQVNYLISFSTPDLSWDTPLCTHTSQPTWTQSEGSWEEQDSLWPTVTPDLIHEKPVCTCVVSPCPRREGAKVLNPLLEQGFALFLSLP